MNEKSIRDHPQPEGPVERSRRGPGLLQGKLALPAVVAASLMARLRGVAGRKKDEKGGGSPAPDRL